MGPYVELEIPQPVLNSGLQTLLPEPSQQPFRQVMKHFCNLCRIPQCTLFIPFYLLYSKLTGRDWIVFLGLHPCCCFTVLTDLHLYNEISPSSPVQPPERPLKSAPESWDTLQNRIWGVCWERKGIFHCMRKTLHVQHWIQSLTFAEGIENVRHIMNY